MSVDAAREIVAETDAQLATRLAVEAGRLLVELRNDMFAEFAAPWQVMDNGDMLAHRYLMHELAEHRPLDAVLSEEGADDGRRHRTDRVWIVDPLDGTNEYGERGRSDWAVHVALWNADRLTAAAVSLPAMDLVFATDPPPELPPRKFAKPRMITSRNRAPHAAVIVANALGCEAVRLGSAGAKAMAVVLGEADIYLHDGGMYQWDSAAPTAVAAAAGLHVSRIDGSPLVYNQRDAWLPDFLLCRHEFAEPVLDALWGERWRRRRDAGWP
ncbi:MAG: 3(2),5-bisphosphate nucleotidase CysQ [Acidimicrobiales bacterium]|nr:3(2),5-bisphosphate nucleotidase CysQ [Acidimicrobiales bacterium]